MAAAPAVKEALWLRNVFGVDVSPVQLLADNQSAIKLLRNPISPLRSKHIDVMHHFARERVMRGDVSFTYVKRDQMLADMLTKALPSTAVAAGASALASKTDDGSSSAVVAVRL